MSKDWATVRVGEVAKLDLDRVSVDPSATYKMVGVYSFGKGLFHKESVLGANTSYKVFYRLKSEHVVMSQLFGWEGALALSSEEYRGRFVSPQFPTFLCDPEKLERRFLGWLIRRPLFWKELGTKTKGMGDRRRTLNPESLLTNEIPLPPLDEQRRIVRQIDELAAKIEEARNLRDEVNEECDALCRSIIFDEAAETTPVAMRELVRWKETDVSVSRNETYHFAGVYCFGKGVFKGLRKAGMEFAYSRLSRLQSGNFVYPKLMAWEGALGVVPPECDGLVVSPEFPVFEVDENRVLPEVLDVYFRTPSVWSKLSDTSTGTNVRRRRLNPSDFLSFKMPLPSMAAQQKLREVKRGVDAIKNMQAETTAELDALLPSVLDKAFKGEL